MRAFSAQVVLLLSMLSFSSVHALQNGFITPPAAGVGQSYAGNPIWHLGDNEEVRWKTEYPTYNITLWQQDISTNRRATLLGVVYSNMDGSTGEQYFNWVVQTYDSTLEDSPVYFFWLNRGGADNMTSLYFNITAASSTTTSSTAISSTDATISETGTPVAIAPTTIISNAITQTIIASDTISSTASTTSSETGTSVAITPSIIASASSIPTSASTSPDNSDPPSNSSLTLKIGLGLGIGLGIPLILIAGFWFGRRAAKKGKHQHRHRQLAGGEHSETKLVPPTSELPTYQVRDPNIVYELNSFGNKNNGRHSPRELE